MLRKLIANKTTLLLILCLLLAAFLRIYKIADYMTFLGDEGRDVLVVKGILEGHFTLLGPRSSAGDFYTGPIYYYMMAPFLWLFHLDPVGPAVMIALLGIATVWLVYYVGKKFFNEKVGLIAAALYTVSPLVIAYSRSSWNPNPMPFFTLLILYLLYAAVQNKSWRYFLIIGVLYGIALQLHYIELLVGVTIFLFVLGSFFVIKSKKDSLLLLLKEYSLLFIGFLVGFSPFLAFEVRHGFPNIRTIANFLIHGDPTAPDLMHDSFLTIVWNVFFRVFARVVWHYPQPGAERLWEPWVMFLWQAAIMITAVAAIVLLLRYKNKLVKLNLGLWLGCGVILFGFYHKPINDYNFEFLFPLPFLLLGYLIYWLYQNKKLGWLGKSGSLGLFAFLFLYNLWYMPFRFSPNKQMQQMKDISEFVLSKTDNKPFNFALITHGNSDHAYRYFFSVDNRDPVTIENTAIDPQRKSVTQQLMVICEDKSCGPLGYPLWEVAGFGRAEIAGQWDLPQVKVFKLVHYTGK